MKKKIYLEKIFSLISIVFGLIYVFILPPFQSVDEAAHFYRGYEIISGKFVPKNINNKIGDYLPSSLQELSSQYNFLIKNIDKNVSTNYILKSSKIKLNPSKISFIEFKNTSLYPPVCYLTQIPGMYLAKAFELNPLLIFYAGRISNLIFFIIIGYLSIKIIPFYKLPLMLLLLMPMTLSLASAITSDVVIIAISFLWISIIVKLLTDDKLINIQQLAVLFLLAFILAISKNCIFLVPLILLLPKSKFKNILNYLLSILGILLIAIVAFFIWKSLIIGFDFNINSNANAAKQLNFILSNPFSFFIIIIKSFIIKFCRIIITMIGVLGWQDTRLDFLTYIIYPILIVTAILLEGKKDFRFQKWQKIILFLVTLLFFLSIFTIIYIIWSRVGNPIIIGLCGKYFIPAMMPLFLLFYNKFSIVTEHKDIIILSILVVIILILFSSDLSIIHRFYNITPNLYYKV